MCLCLGLSETGLFRVGGSVKHCKELRKSFDEGGFPELDSMDVHTSASLLKVFIRELPGGLIPEPHRMQLLQVFSGKWSWWWWWVLSTCCSTKQIYKIRLNLTESLYFADSKKEELNQVVKSVLNSLPEEHFNVLCYLMFFLSRVAAESHLNLMTSKNLSIVFGSNIFQ